MAKKKINGGSKNRAKHGQTKEVPVQAYDLGIISRENLMKYIAALEKELALMRKDCAFYSTNQIKIMEFLETRREEFMKNKMMSVVNNAAMDDTIEQLRKFPVKYNEMKVFKDREKVRRKLENAFEDFVACTSAQADHIDQEHPLKQQIGDKDKRLESDQFFCQMTLMDMKESCQNVLENMDGKYGKKLEVNLVENVNKCLEDNQRFNAEKIRTLISVWDIAGHSSEMKESYISEMKRMQDFFLEISSNNAEVIKVLRKKLADLLIESQKTNFNLRQVLQQNAGLKDLQPEASLHPRNRESSLRFPCSAGKVQNQKLMKLQYRNDCLRIHLHTVKTELKNLRNQFVAATRKIYQKAEFKAFVTEEMIRMTIEMESLKSIGGDTSTRKYEREIKDSKEKSKSIEDIVNTFNLSVENSDTLFVPPVYHEFWDPSIKYTLD